MKRILFPVLLILLAVSCQREEELPDATSAAKEVYLQYADRKDLTVALIGDYQGYNAVMLQAQDNEGWLRLCEEFGVKKHVNADVLDTTRVSSLTIGNVRSIEGDDSQALKELLEDDSAILENILMNPTLNVRVDTAFTIVHQEHWVHGVLADSSTYMDTDNQQREDQLTHKAIAHGHTGYIIRDDSDELTLWIFFYSTPAEKEQILNNVTSINTQK